MINQELSQKQLFEKLLKHTSRRRHWQFALLLVLTLASSFAEIISLSALVPFIGILTQPEKVHTYLNEHGVSNWINLPQASDLVLPLTIAFALAAILAGVLRLVLSWVSIRLTNGIGTDLSIEVYRRTLYQPYRIHVERNTSEIISSITNKIASSTGMLLSLMNVITSAAIFSAILITLIAIDPIVALVAMLSFGTCYGIIAIKTRKKIASNGKAIAVEQTNVVKSLQEGLGAIREILLDGTQEVYCYGYRSSLSTLERASGENNYINQAPRFVMESVGMVLIAIFAYSLSFREGGIQSSLPILAALALGAQRLLPLLQILYGNWTVYLGNKASLADVIKLLDQPMPEYFGLPIPDPMQFQNAICFEDVSFKYKADSPLVLDHINLEIKKGSRIGLVGSTGSGKSTALDILMALLEPTSGRVTIDGMTLNHHSQRAWQRSIATVPQSIYLTDATIAENIAFGVPKDKINMDQVRTAAKKAQIADFIEESEYGYEAKVGERGVRLSGGQRQRIGIARALYKKAKVLIFDEATSALDSLTEKAVMSAIEGLDKDLTIIIIAHRITTLENCDVIIQLDRGQLQFQGSYAEYIKRQVETP